MPNSKDTSTAGISPKPPKTHPCNLTSTQWLYREIFGELPKRDMVADDMPILLSVIGTLFGREQEIVSERFGLGCDRMTIQAIADEFKITDSRVKQIEARGIRSLRDESRASRIRPLFYSYSELRAEIRERDEMIANLKKVRGENYHLRQRVRELEEKTHATPTVFSALPPLDWPIEKLELSTRAYHYLNLAGLNTIRDVVIKHNSGGKDSGLNIVRNIGKRSVEEIVKVLEKLEIPLNQPEEFYYK
jgi:hypothetical protein